MLPDDNNISVELSIIEPIIKIENFELLPTIVYRLPTINNEVFEIPVIFDPLPFELSLILDDSSLVPSIPSNISYGVISASFDVDIISSGIIPDETLQYGSTSMSTIFSKSVSGIRTTFGQIVAPFTFTKAVSGITIDSNQYGSGIYGTGLYGDVLTQYGSISRTTTFVKVVSGTKKTFGQLTIPVTFIKSISGTKETFSYIAAPFTFMKSVAGINIAVNTQYGSSSMSVVFGKSVSGTKKTFGQFTVPVTFIKSISGTRNTFSQISAPFTFTKSVSGTKKTFGQIAASITFTKAVSGIRTGPMSTSVAEISLASHVAPSVRDRHSIKIRARTTSGSGGVIKAALYEGTTNISGDLTSSTLSNSLADYTLTISDASAAAITSYSNLSIKIWGYETMGTGLVFEIARVYLELPAS